MLRFPTHLLLSLSLRPVLRRLPTGHNQTVAGGCATSAHRATCPNNLTLANNTLVNGSDWPAAALAVAAAAGVQPATELF